MFPWLSSPFPLCSRLPGCPLPPASVLPASYPHPPALCRGPSSLSCHLPCHVLAGLGEGSLHPAPLPCVRLGGVSPGTAAETPTWHSPECLAAGQGVADMWGGGQLRRWGADPAWSAPPSGEGMEGLADGTTHVTWSPSALSSLSCSLLSLRPLCLSVCL